jgi:hypothetical protein
MSTYRNFFNDYPARAVDLLALWDEARGRKLEVTLLLAVASQAFVMPLERLGVVRLDNHPSRDDREYVRAKTKLEFRCNQTCAESPLFSASDLNSWRYSSGLYDDVSRETVTPANIRSINSMHCREIFRIVRDAFAHAHIMTEGDPITRLFFLSVVRDTYPKQAKRLECGVSTFRSFVEAWGEELRQWDISPAH